MRKLFISSLLATAACAALAAPALADAMADAKAIIAEHQKMPVFVAPG